MRARRDHHGIGIGQRRLEFVECARVGAGELNHEQLGVGGQMRCEVFQRAGGIAGRSGEGRVEENDARAVRGCDGGGRAAAGMLVVNGAGDGRRDGAGAGAGEPFPTDDVAGRDGEHGEPDGSGEMRHALGFPRMDHEQWHTNHAAQQHEGAGAGQHLATGIHGGIANRWLEERLGHRGETLRRGFRAGCRDRGRSSGSPPARRRRRWRLSRAATRGSFLRPCRRRSDGRR